MNPHLIRPEQIDQGGADPGDQRIPAGDRRNPASGLAREQIRQSRTQWAGPFDEFSTDAEPHRFGGNEVEMTTPAQDHHSRSQCRQSLDRTARWALSAHPHDVDHVWHCNGCHSASVT